MQCTHPVPRKNNISGVWQETPCGQCLPCRLNKQAYMIFRNHMECRTSLTSSFWTLTLDDEGLATLDKRGPRKMISNFIDALRKSEVRAGNSLPIRFYGCLEFGSEFGRPHWHMLLYNLVNQWKQPPKYLRGLPRPRFTINLWPHGHVDIGEFNPATIRYTISYLFKDSRAGARPIVYQTIRPATGYYGIKSLAESFAQKHGTLPSPPTSFSIKGKRYPADQWTRGTFRNLFQKAGGKFDRIFTADERRIASLELKIARDMLPNQAEADRQYLQTLETLIGQKEIEKRAREEHVYKILAARNKAIQTLEAGNQETLGPLLKLPEEDCPF